MALKGVPGWRQGETAGFAEKEGRVEFALKAFEAQAHGRRRDAEFFRGVRDVERAREREKGFEVGKVEMHDRAARLVVSLSSLTILAIFAGAQKTDFHRPQEKPSAPLSKGGAHLFTGHEKAGRLTGTSGSEGAPLRAERNLTLPVLLPSS